MDLGDELIYRLRDYEPSERVRVITAYPGKQRTRYDVEFLDGEKVGTIENVPENRLKGPWAGVADYDELMRNWERLLGQRELTQPEELAIERAFLLLMPPEIAEWEWKPVRWVTRILDREGLETRVGFPVADLLVDVEWFELDGDLLVSPAGTLAIAEAACRVNPTPVLDWILADEKKYRERTKHGRETKHLITGEPSQTSPEWEYQMYLDSGRPMHELLRAWCGHRAVTVQERLAAAEAEVQRLDQLVVRLIDELKHHEPDYAVDHFIREHDEERITASNYRPVVDRPSGPSEIASYEVPARRRRRR